MGRSATGLTALQPTRAERPRPMLRARSAVRKLTRVVLPAAVLLSSPTLLTGTAHAGATCYQP